MGGIEEPGPGIETERLRLRPVSGCDLEDLYQIFVAPGVRRYLLDDKIVSREWVEAEIRASRKRFANLGAGIWALLPKDTNILAGFCGFRFFHDPPELQLLYGSMASPRPIGLGDWPPKPRACGNEVRLRGPSFR
ncbi:MAG TPA: GNAT family N-acetyltransferase [Rubrobacteraceae bacterium]|nr:GNAT family N-acetyltransferase [Rubrobacteraceae bacterium]